MKKVLSIVAIIVFSFQLQAQTHEILGHFTSAELNGKVLLNWQIVKGQTCNGIQIYRSVNNSDFVQIGEIPGVCGSSLEAINYNFTDNNPIPNEENLYRLDLGGYGNSETIRRQVSDVLTEGFQIKPHPVVGASKLFFSNLKKKEHTITIYNITGQVIEQAQTNADFFEVNSTSYRKGIYFFTVKTNSGQLLTSGKIVIQ